MQTAHKAANSKHMPMNNGFKRCMSLVNCSIEEDIEIEAGNERYPKEKEGEWPKVVEGVPLFPKGEVKPLFQIEVAAFNGVST